jgi:hypothetical protein
LNPPAGTDPGEGSALGIALLRTLVKGGPGGGGLTLASTHQGALTSLKYEDERFENASVEFDEVKLAPTYRFDRRPAAGLTNRQLAALDWPSSQVWLSLANDCFCMLTNGGCCLLQAAVGHPRAQQRAQHC